MDTLKDMITFFIIAAILGLVATWLRSRKKAILKKTETLILWAETQIRGSGMGVEKKALVIAKLKEDGVSVTKWLSKAIDNTVAFLNSTSGWIKESADVEGTVKNLANKVKGDE